MLTRRRRTQILADSRPAVAEDLAALVERHYPVVEVFPPRQGLVMCQVRETARNSRFYLGEALMTECRVRIGEVEGLGAVLGSNSAQARAMAVVDAALSHTEPLTCTDELERKLLEAESVLLRDTAHDRAQTLVSRVDFDTMGGQDMSVQAVAK